MWQYHLMSSKLMSSKRDKEDKRVEMVDVPLTDTKTKTPKKISAKMAANAINVGTTKKKKAKKVKKKNLKVRTLSSGSIIIKGRKKKKNRRKQRSSVITEVPEVTMKKAKAVATKYDEVNRMFDTAKTQLSQTSYGTAVDGDPMTNIPISSANIQITAILGSGGSSSFHQQQQSIILDQPVSVSVNSSMDRYRCSSLQEKISDFHIADILIVDLSRHCVHRYSCATAKYINIPMDAIELLPPNNDELSYNLKGDSVSHEWMLRIQEKDPVMARFLKTKKIMDAQEHRKPVYIRCLQEPDQHKSEDHGHPVPEAIVLASNTDDRPFIYLCGEIEEFSTERHKQNGEDGIVKITFPNVRRYTYRGLVGHFDQSSLVKEEDILGVTEYVVKSSAVTLTNDGSSENVGNEDGSSSSKTKNGASIDKDDVALHKIILAEDMKNTNNNLSTNTFKTTTTKGFLQNQFTGPVATTFVNSGSYMVIDANADDPGCSPRVQFFDGATQTCQKIISNTTSDTAKSRTLMRKTYKSPTSSLLTIKGGKRNEKTTRNHQRNHPGCLLFRDEAGVVLRGRRISPLIQTWGQIIQNNNKMMWKKGVAIGRSMPFLSNDNVKELGEQIVKYHNIPMDTTFELDIRNIHTANTTSERMVLRRNSKDAVDSENKGEGKIHQKTKKQKQNKNKKQKQKNGENINNEDNEFLVGGYLSEWSGDEKEGFTELLNWSFVNDIPMWYKAEEADHENTPVLQVRVSLAVQNVPYSSLISQGQPLPLPLPLPSSTKKEKKKKKKEKEKEKEKEKKNKKKNVKRRPSYFMKSEEIETKQEENHGTNDQSSSSFRIHLQTLSNEFMFPNYENQDANNTNIINTPIEIMNIHGTIKDVKIAIQQHNYIPYQHQRLMLNGMHLDDHRTLSSCGFRHKTSHDDNDDNDYNDNDDSKSDSDSNDNDDKHVLHYYHFLPRIYLFFNDGSGCWRDENGSDSDIAQCTGPTHPFYYRTNYVVFHYGTKDDLLKDTKTDDMNSTTCVDSFNNHNNIVGNIGVEDIPAHIQWYPHRSFLRVNNQLRSITRHRARFRMWNIYKDVGEFRETMKSQKKTKMNAHENRQKNAHMKRLGKYAPDEVEELFDDIGLGVQMGYNALDDEFGYTPWMDVTVISYDPDEKYHYVQIDGLHSPDSMDCNIDEIWKELLIKSERPEQHMNGNHHTPISHASTHFHHYCTEYPYCLTSDLKDVDDGKRFIERPVFRAPLGISTSNGPPRTKMTKITYEDTIASSFYVSDSVHSVVHCFQHPFKGPRGFDNFKNTELYVKRSYQWSFGVRGSLPGELCNPTGMSTWITEEEEHEHIVIADTNNNRIQCFIRFPGGAGVHYECMYPVEEGATEHDDDKHGNGGNNDNDDVRKERQQMTSSSCLLRSPSDVSVRVINGVVLVYVCDTGNHCIRIFIVQTEVIDYASEEGGKKRQLSPQAFCKIPAHEQWMYVYRTKDHVYIRTVPRRKFILVGTWGGFGTGPGYFITPSSIDTFETVAKKHTEQEFTDSSGGDSGAVAAAGGKKVGISVVVADPGNNRVQILEHHVNFYTKEVVMNESKGGCCTVM